MHRCYFHLLQLKSGRPCNIRVKTNGQQHETLFIPDRVITCTNYTVQCTQINYGFYNKTSGTVILATSSVWLLEQEDCTSNAVLTGIYHAATMLSAELKVL